MGLFSKRAEKKEEQKHEKVAEVQPAPNENLLVSLPLNLIQPRISEKAGALGRLNKYVFVVKNKTNKVEVKKAVESKYQVKVVRVNIVNTKGKIKRLGQIAGKTPGFKKAIVTLKKGESIKGLTETV